MTMRANRYETAGQGALDFEVKSAAPEASPEDVRRLCGVLAGREWTTAAELAGLMGPGWTDRKVRAVARAATPGIVSFPGSPGYKLLRECSLDEINRAIDAFRSQANDMTARAVLYHNAYHARAAVARS